VGLELVRLAVFHRLLVLYQLFRPQTDYCFVKFYCSDAVPSLLDPPEHLFRIRLVCVLLETCGQYFDRGSSKKKLDCFLVYFQVMPYSFPESLPDLLIRDNVYFLSFSVI
jgi:hypothetical protein